MEPLHRLFAFRTARPVGPRVGALLAVLLLGDVAPVRADGPRADRRPPNILVLLADDQRPDTVYALGNPRIRTPNLDRLVRAGTAFTRAVSPNPLCVPSRAEILTGCPGFRNGVLPPFHNRLDPDLVPWPEALRRASYRTWHVGKWHVAGRPTARGFDESRGLFAPGGPTRPARRDARGREITGYVGWVFQDDQGRLFPEQGVGLTPGIDARFADAAIELIRRRSDRPFFLQVNFTAPPMQRPWNKLRTSSGSPEMPPILNLLEGSTIDPLIRRHASGPIHANEHANASEECGRSISGSRPISSHSGEEAAGTFIADRSLSTTGSPSRVGPVVGRRANAKYSLRGRAI